LLVFGIVLVGSIGLNMWLPAEKITFHGRSSATMYVLEESDRALVIFNAKQNSIERVSRLQVDTRQFCAKRGFARHAMPLCP
jgi:hypothetical protein